MHTVDDVVEWFVYLVFESVKRIESNSYNGIISVGGLAIVIEAYKNSRAVEGVLLKPDILTPLKGVGSRFVGALHASSYRVKAVSAQPLP